jgi:hypothetical protein
MIVHRHLRSYLLELLDSQLPRLMGEFLNDLNKPTSLLIEPVQPLVLEAKRRRLELIDRLSHLFEQDNRSLAQKMYDKEDAEKIVDNLEAGIREVLDDYWLRIRQLKDEYDRFSSIGATSMDQKRARAKHRAYKEITTDPDHAYVLNYFAEAGLLPAYQFPQDTSYLDPGVEDTPNLYRSKSIAIEEFAPGNLVYANNHKLKSIRLLFSGTGRRAFPTSTDTLGSVVDYYFCDQCGHATDQVQNLCPECGSRMGAATSVVFPEAYEAEEQTSITSSEEVRDRRFFVRKEHVLAGPDGKADLYEVPFLPMELWRDSRILITNWGKRDRETGEGEKFEICPLCGRQKPRDDEKWDEWHRNLCSGQPEPVVLGYEFVTDALIITLPPETLAASAFCSFDERFAYTLSEAILTGASTYLEVEPGEIRSFVRQTWKEGRHYQIVMYETVPGGAGYLAQIAAAFPEVAKESYDRLFNHYCIGACYRCLKRYDNQRIHSKLDKEKVRQVLFHTMLEEPVDPKQVDVGTSVIVVRNQMDARQIEHQEYLLSKNGTQSPIESRLLQAMREVGGLPEPEKQFEIYDDRGRLVTVPDFAYPEKKIAIFCDGYQYHSPPEVLEADSWKRNYLEKEHWYVLVYWGRTINRAADRCARQIAEVYASSRS